MHLFFSTPIWINEISNHESINTELENYIYNQREKNPKGTKKSNVNGWHSEEFDLKKEATKAKRLSSKKNEDNKNKSKTKK